MPTNQNDTKTMPILNFSLKHLSAITVGLVPFLLGGCQTLPASNSEQPATTPTQLQHAYDFVIIDSSTRRTLSVQELSERLKPIDVVFIGEFHGNHASHLLEMQLLAALYQQRPQQVLSMEMFNRDQQNMVNQYLDDENRRTILDSRGACLA